MDTNAFDIQEIKRVGKSFYVITFVILYIVTTLVKRTDNVQHNMQILKLSGLI